MPIKPKQDLKKLENERLTALVMEMLKEEENKYCADCEAKQPRWASWNLGVFLCIRCAGLHRNLGVHISKVKSVSLDTWLPEQVQSMRVMGNAKAKAIYECELPPTFRRPQTDQALEHFIRAKYDSKRYIMKGWIPPKVDVNDLPPLLEPATNKNTSAGKKLMPVKDLPSATSSTSPKPATAKGSPEKKNEANLVDLFDSAPTTDNTNNSSSHHQNADFLGLDSSSPTKSAPPPQNDDNLDDLFGSMVSAPSAVSMPPSVQQPGLMSAAPISESKSVDQLSNGLEGLDFSGGSKALNNDAIMALYNKPSSAFGSTTAASAMPMSQSMSAVGAPPQSAAFGQFGAAYSSAGGYSQQAVGGGFAQFPAPSGAVAQSPTGGWTTAGVTSPGVGYGQANSSFGMPASGLMASPPVASGQTFGLGQQPEAPSRNSKPSTSAFDDLFATASAHFGAASSNSAATNSGYSKAAPQASVPAAAATTTQSSSAAHQDLESLFM